MTNPTQTPKKLSAGTKLISEFLPLILFFVAFKFAGIMMATAVFMVAIAGSVAYSWAMTRHIPPMLIITFVIVMFLGGLTLYLNDETFVKIKPTIVFLIFASLLLGGLLSGRLFLKMFLVEALPHLSDRLWRIMTWQWIIFYALMAGANEFIWRTQTTDTWVNYKTFGVIPLTLVFSFVQIAIMVSKSPPPTNNSNED